MMRQILHNLDTLGKSDGGSTDSPTDVFPTKFIMLFMIRTDAPDCILENGKNTNELKNIRCFGTADTIDFAMRMNELTN